MDYYFDFIQKWTSDGGSSHRYVVTFVQGIPVILLGIIWRKFSCLNLLCLLLLFLSFFFFFGGGGGGRGEKKKF